MTKYRNNVEIVAAILTIAKTEALKTHIMYQANLSFKLTEAYLNKVLQVGLIRILDDGRYKITQKGGTFLEKFDKYRRHKRSLQEKLRTVRDERMALHRMCFQSGIEEAGCVDKPNERAKVKSRASST
jgi:predicted transcriptional regulator